MITNTIARNDQTVKQIALRNGQETFTNMIVEGTYNIDYVHDNKK